MLAIQWFVRKNTKIHVLMQDSLMLARNAAEKVIPRMLDYDEFADLVLHAHYINRNTGYAD